MNRKAKRKSGRGRAKRTTTRRKTTAKRSRKGAARGRQPIVRKSITRTNEWEATPEELDSPESDENDKADRFEDFEARSSMMRTLEPRLNNILKALKGLNRES